MRKNLKKYDGERGIFSATFEKYGYLKNRNKKIATALLRDIKDESGEIVADHVWMTLNKGFCDVGILEQGDEIKIDAVVKPYTKREPKTIIERPRAKICDYSFKSLLGIEKVLH